MNKNKDVDIKLMPYTQNKLINERPLGLKVRTIDNPGSGNCGYYAFAIGLIDIIKKEKIYNSRAIFHRWVNLDNSLKRYYEDICHYNFDNSDRNLLEKLQKSLRIITYNTQLDELRKACAAAKKEDEYQSLVATSTYRKFCELFYGSYLDPRFNEFIKSLPIRNALAQIDKSKLIAEHEALVLAPLFITLIYGKGRSPGAITPTTQFLPTSPIINALRGITEDKVWATHLELDYLATAFKVNLHTLENGRVPYPFHDIPERHTVTVNNLFNFHWTTQITVLEGLDLKDKALGFNSSSSIAIDPKRKNAFPVENGFAPVKEPPKASLESANFEQKKLNQLIRIVNRAVINYCNYSDSIWFSLFHRHGETGRKRAIKFNAQFNRIENYSEAMEMVICFLQDHKNGNTYPHSLRTMILQELLTLNSNKTLGLIEISRKFDLALTHLIKKNSALKIAVLGSI